MGSLDGAREGRLEGLAVLTGFSVGFAVDAVGLEVIGAFVGYHVKGFSGSKLSGSRSCLSSSFNCPIIRFLLVNSRLVSIDSLKT